MGKVREESDNKQVSNEYLLEEAHLQIVPLIYAANAFTEVESYRCHEQTGRQTAPNENAY